ncbi:hypothetical protein HY416_04085 [Candidatus Kaiserbacteria bacterium]|nr:hypothetical protein [Candidatus Kaiserbacteria bacterium]
MVTPKQKVAAKRNVKKAQAVWKGMTKRQHSLAQPEGRARKKPGTTGKGKFYRIEIRPKGEFKTFRVQDVGKKGGLERLAGRRSSGSWDTVTWLVAKEEAHVGPNGQLVIDSPRARTALTQIVGPIVHVKGDVFRAHPKKNVPESAKPTPAMRRAQKTNIKKAQAARRK